MAFRVGRGPPCVRSFDPDALPHRGPPTWSGSLGRKSGQKVWVSTSVHQEAGTAQLADPSVVSDSSELRKELTVELTVTISVTSAPRQLRR